MSNLWGAVCSLIICTALYNESSYLMNYSIFHHFYFLLHYISLIPHNSNVLGHFSCKKCHHCFKIFHNPFYVCCYPLFLTNKPICPSHDFDWTVHNIMLSLHATIPVTMSLSFLYTASFAQCHNFIYLLHKWHQGDRGVLIDRYIWGWWLKSGGCFN